MELFSHLFAFLSPVIFLGACLSCGASSVTEQYRLVQQKIPFVDEAERFVLPFSDSSWSDRFIEIRKNRDGYQYGPPLLGNTSFFPTGVLGEARVRNDKQLWFRDVQYVTENVYKEWPLAGQALAATGGLQNLSSFAAMYENQWKGTIPDGVSPGMLTNWTQDLLFSMERLSSNPYVVRRLDPELEGLPYAVDGAAVEKLTGQTLDQLHTSGRLFFADHTIQKEYPTNSGRWTAACSAYFFIHPTLGDFLPLAIRTHVGSDLIFTPLDDENDWLMAKMAFEMNDLFHGQIFHLSNTHDVAEPVHQAALRTLSKRHPVRGYLDRLMYQAYAVRPIGDEFLFNDGGFFDSSFAPTNFGGRKLSSDLYPVSAGLFRSSDFDNDLVARGLVNCTYGPPLKSMPFYDTVKPMTQAIRRFTEAYVRAYYPLDTHLVRDHELQGWVLEAIEGAQVLDFPTFPLATRDTLVFILSHIAFLAGIGHHVLNGATPGESSGILPLHPSAFNKPLPTRKGSIDSLMPYLHNETEALKQASLLVRFNRPLVEEQKGNLVNMWSGIDFLARTCPAVIRAAESFQNTMLEISDGIRAQAFDHEGLAQGMPFIWRSLDPRRIPYYLSV